MVIKERSQYPSYPLFASVYSIFLLLCTLRSVKSSKLLHCQNCNLLSKLFFSMCGRVICCVLLPPWKLFDGLEQLNDGHYTGNWNIELFSGLFYSITHHVKINDPLPALFVVFYDFNHDDGFSQWVRCLFLYTQWNPLFIYSICKIPYVCSNSETLIQD